MYSILYWFKFAELKGDSLSYLVKIYFDIARRANQITKIRFYYFNFQKIYFNCTILIINLLDDLKDHGYLYSWSNIISLFYFWFLNFWLIMPDHLLSLPSPFEIIMNTFCFIITVGFITIQQNNLILSILNLNLWIVSLKLLKWIWISTFIFIY